MVITSKINSNLQGFNPVLDETGKITGYKTTVGGADTVFPFKSNLIFTFGFGFGAGGNQSTSSIYINVEMYDKISISAFSYTGTRPVLGYFRLWADGSQKYMTTSVLTSGIELDLKDCNNLQISGFCTQGTSWGEYRSTITLS